MTYKGKCAISFACCIAFAALSFAPDANASYKAFAQQYASLIREVMKADDIMYTQMKLVADKLERYYQVHGHFPTTDEEKAKFERIAHKVLSGNPYKPKIKDMVTGKEVVTDDPVPIYILTDGGLNAQNAAQYMQKPPSGWQGEPGSIYILTNGLGFYLMWAPSADKLPIRDFTSPTTKPRMLANDLYGREQTELSNGSHVQ